MKDARKKFGFTIVELLIVVVVIAILAAITIVAYTGIQANAKRSSHLQALAQFSKAFNLYSVDKGTAPYIGAQTTEVACVSTGNWYDSCSVAAAAQASASSRISMSVTNDLFSKLQALGVRPESGFQWYTTVSYAPAATPLAVPSGNYVGMYLYSIWGGTLATCPQISGLSFLSITSPAGVPADANTTSGTFTACRYTFTSVS